MKILQLDIASQTETLLATKKTLAAGGLVIFPTETTYGAGVLATNKMAVKRLLTYKHKREGKPLSIAVADQVMAEQYAIINKQAKILYQQLLPGPVTIISKAKLNTLAPGVISEFGTLGVRIPDHQFVLDLIKNLGKPITATSANASGKSRPYSITTLLQNLSFKQKALIDLVIDAGTLPANPPSTIIDTTLSTPVTLRQGATKVFSQKNVISIESNSVGETKQIAGKLCLQHWDRIGKFGLVFALDGPLGVGKTIFAQGVAKFLGISEQLTSPTYNYIQEYDFVRHQTTGKLFHCDLWKVDSRVTCERLELTNLFGPNKIVAIEWFSQVQTYLEPLINATQAKLIRIKFSETNSGRLLTFFYEKK